MPVTTTDRLLAGTLLALAILGVAGIVHIVTILVIPRLVDTDPFARLSSATAPARMQLLPRPAPGSPFGAFSDPAMARGACLFDLSKAALRLAGTIDEGRLLTLSFRTRAGYVFFSMTDRAAVRGELNILVVSPQQLEEIEAASNAEEDSAQELRLVTPTTEGIVLVEALSSLPGEWTAAEEAITRIRCEAEPVSDG
jgi:uncharacterized membrane protein